MKSLSFQIPYFVPSPRKSPLTRLTVTLASQKLKIFCQLWSVSESVFKATLGIVSNIRRLTQAGLRLQNWLSQNWGKEVFPRFRISSQNFWQHSLMGAFKYCISTLLLLVQNQNRIINQHFIKFVSHKYRLDHFILVQKSSFWPA